LQALANFIGVYVGPETALAIALITRIGLLVHWCYFFCYIREVEEREYNDALQFTLQQSEVGGWNWKSSDEAFDSWVKRVNAERKKLGLP
jgi:hypothetical protein